VTEVHADDDRGVETVSGILRAPVQAQVFGIAGVGGNGQSQLVETITGMHNPTDGSITYLGEPMADESRREHIDRGMAFIPKTGRSEGLVMSYDPDRERYPRKPARPAVRRGRPARLARLVITPSP